MRDQLTTSTGLTLRRWDDTDATAVLAAFAPAEMVRQAGRPILDAADALLWLADRRRDWDGRTGYSWAVVDHRATVLGSVTVSSVDRRHDTGWVSYWIVESARGRGVAAAAAGALCGWAFEDLGLFRLELGHRTNNPASCRVAERAGFKVEGLERAKLRYGEKRYDVELHARLATDPG
ncbi:GNAT family N-acetyltransferase [Streptacidiphilus sp. PAMC 29251]